MSAKDYHICPAIFNAYIAKVSKKNPNKMTDDRKVIEEDEIMGLIDWWLDKNCDAGEHGVAFESHLREGLKVHVEFKKIEKK